MIQRLKNFLKKETVLAVATVLAIASAFLVHPSGKYMEYIDWHTLGMLLSLMIVTEGLKQNGFFDYVGIALLRRTKKVWQLVAVLVLLPFFFSMVITNDVALLTFVPFSVQILKQGRRDELMIPTIVLQTIAANMGSMLTPIGNPHNLYLYGASGLGVIEFMKLMLPYTAFSLLLLILSICFLKGKNETIQSDKQTEKVPKKVTRKAYVYLLLFVGSVLVVAKLVPLWAVLLCTIIFALILNWSMLLKLDYALLLTFIGFFIFTGNIRNIPAVRDVLESVIAGKEMLLGIGLSQVISNVPTSILLSSFTNNSSALIIAANIGGLGTIIASMASLISYKIFVNYDSSKKGKYVGCFTIVNMIYLAVLIGLSFLL